MTVTVVVGTGCFVIPLRPRSVGVHQSATPLARQELEVILSAGVAYASDFDPSNVPSAPGTRSSTFSVPAMEGNVTYGLTDTVAINVRGTLAGIQPGAKVSLIHGTLNLAVLPEFGFGYLSGTVNDGGSGIQSAFTLLVGGKLLVSHSSGVYGALGYDFQHIGLALATGVTPSAGGSRIDAHNLAFVLGYALEFSQFELRPEIAFMYVPAKSYGLDAPTGNFAWGGGSGWVLFPNVALAVRSGNASQAKAKQGSTSDPSVKAEKKR